MEEYLKATTIHGFIYFGKENSIITRLFWGCVTSIGFVIAACLINASYDNWNIDQTVTTLDSIAAPITEVQFPTVTVCPHPDETYLMISIYCSVSL